MQGGSRKGGAYIQGANGGLRRRGCTWSALWLLGSQPASLRLWLLLRRLIWVLATAAATAAAAGAIIWAAALIIVAVVSIAPLAKLLLLVEDAALCRGRGGGRQARRQVWLAVGQGCSAAVLPVVALPHSLLDFFLFMNSLSTTSSAQRTPCGGRQCSSRCKLTPPGGLGCGRPPAPQQPAPATRHQDVGAAPTLPFSFFFFLGTSRSTRCSAGGDGDGRAVGARVQAAANWQAPPQRAWRAARTTTTDSSSTHP